MYKRLFYVPVLVLLIAMPVMGQQTSPDPGIGETVASFFDWYIEYLETNTYQMDDAYQSSPYLTDTLIDELSAEYASEPMADPVLCAQALPDFYTIEVSGDNTAGESATVLVRQYFSSPLTHNIEVDLLRVDGDWKLDDIHCQDTVTPRGVVDAFYTRWTNYSRIDTDTEDHSNPIVDRIWRESDLVTENLVQTMDSLVDSDTPLGYDPVLCAQDFPASIVPLEIDVQDGQARVLVNEFFGDFVIPHRVLVTLNYEDTDWLIDAITCDVPPEIITLSFYRLYTDFTRYDMSYGIDRTQLADWGFNWNMYLSESLESQLVDLFTGDEPLAADPVVCAQDIPEWVEVAPLEASDMTARLQVSGYYSSGPDSMTSYDLASVEVIREQGRWIINDIVCSAQD